MTVMGGLKRMRLSTNEMLATWKWIPHRMQKEAGYQLKTESNIRSNRRLAERSNS